MPSKNVSLTNAQVSPYLLTSWDIQKEEKNAKKREEERKVRQEEAKVIERHMFDKDEREKAEIAKQAERIHQRRKELRQRAEVNRQRFAEKEATKSVVKKPSPSNVVRQKRSKKHVGVGHTQHQGHEDATEMPTVSGMTTLVDGNTFDAVTDQQIKQKCQINANKYVERGPSGMYPGRHPGAVMEASGTGDQATMVDDEKQSLSTLLTTAALNNDDSEEAQKNAGGVTTTGKDQPSKYKNASVKNTVTKKNISRKQRGLVESASPRGSKRGSTEQYTVPGSNIDVTYK